LVFTVAWWDSTERFVNTNIFLFIAKSVNFTPYTSASQRKTHAVIAIGESLPDSYYDGIHTETGFDSSKVPVEDNEGVFLFEKAKESETEVTFSTRNSIEVITSVECKKALESIFAYLIEKIDGRN